MLSSTGLFTFAEDARRDEKRQKRTPSTTGSSVKTKSALEAAKPKEGGDVGAAKRAQARIFGPILRGLPRPFPGGFSPYSPAIPISSTAGRFLEHRATPELMALMPPPACASIANRGSPKRPTNVKSHGRSTSTSDQTVLAIQKAARPGAAADRASARD